MGGAGWSIDIELISRVRTMSGPANSIAPSPSIRSPNGECVLECLAKWGRLTSRAKVDHACPCRVENADLLSSYYCVSGTKSRFIWGTFIAPRGGKY